MSNKPESADNDAKIAFAKTLGWIHVPRVYGTGFVDADGKMKTWFDLAQAALDHCASAQGSQDSQNLRALWLALAGGPKPRCRDCADEDGTCPSDKLPCDPQERALKQIEMLRASPQQGQDVSVEELASVIFDDAVGKDKLHNEFYREELIGCQQTARVILEQYHVTPRAASLPLQEEGDGT